ncbi:hypothetical protein [Hymenobacter sp. 102]|uniref:hypothetical protein n=1 Tax=Hymenobacter sp. 102 TaxID=3403152 RepID=UPI003CEE1DB6
MKNLLLWGAILLMGASACRRQCPAYSATKPANRVASSLTASAPAPATNRQ